MRLEGRKGVDKRPFSLRMTSNTPGKGFGKKAASPSRTMGASSDELKGMNVILPTNSGGASLSTETGPVASGEKDPASSPPTNLDEVIESTALFKSNRERDEALLDEKIARLKEEQDMLATDPSVGAVPEMVADRMIGRIATFFGVPVFGGLAIFVGAYFYSKQTDMIIQPNIIAYATQVPFILGLIGITYGIMSASWEPESDGSLLGIREFKTNFGRVKDGLKRTRETAELKDDIERDSKKLGRK
jgi:hypothetical protein